MEFFQMLLTLLAVGCLLATVAALFWPERGLLARLRGRRQQMQLEDCLKYLHTAELETVPATLPGLSAARRINLPLASEILLKLERLGFVERKARAIQLTPAGETPPQSGIPLATAPLDTSLRIVHIEDEPEPIYAELLAAGLYPGMELRVVERSATQMRIRVGRDEHILRSPVAANLLVQPHAESAARTPRARLSDLRVGERGEVVGIAPGCRRMERRRLQDLGVLPETVIQAEFASPSSDPVAYRIRGALIALRREQAAHILVDRPEDTHEP